jgi:hypothetical protein
MRQVANRLRFATNMRQSGRCALSRVTAEHAGWRSNYPPGCGVATLCSLASIQHAIDARPGNPEFLRDAGKA